MTKRERQRLANTAGSVRPRPWGWWTGHKLQILGDYLQAFAKASQSVDQRIYLDLFAGWPKNVSRETEEPILESGERVEVVWCEGFSLHDGEVDFDLIEPACVDGRVHHDQVCATDARGVVGSGRCGGRFRCRPPRTPWKQSDRAPGTSLGGPVFRRGRYRSWLRNDRRFEPGGRPMRPSRPRLSCALTRTAGQAVWE